ncbi:MAG TPA: DUF72 domain-containing protein [Candidatus Limnocylindrales bacterium]|nr:DUF72 domain-containing protein [Candidatus Limnocylindrales bacterium]
MPRESRHDRTSHDPGPDAAAERAAGLEDVAAEPIPAPSGGLIRVGTASWADPTMTAPGVFYPRDADTAEERLQYYAGTFPLVEVDATYYALPSERTARLWVERTPPDFVFDAKAHALMTGQPTEVKRLPKALREELPEELRQKARIYAKDLPDELEAEVWRLFLEGLGPLRDSGQLGSVLLQYPRWVFPSNESREAILRAKARLGDQRFAVEFRNASWLNNKNLDRTLRFLADNAIPFVMVDEPQGFKSSLPPVVAVTSSDLAIVRFHGRRAETWEAQGIAVVERFRYLYDRRELEEWAPKVRQAASQARETHVLMNNCFANYGATNAREMAKLLREMADAEVRAGAGGEPDSGAGGAADGEAGA